MNAADIAILAVLALSTLFGLLRGFVLEAFSLLRWVAAFWVAWAFGHRVAAFYGAWLAEPTARILAGYITCFVGVLILGSLLGLLVRRLAYGLHLRAGDHFLGMLFGLARGLVLVSFVVLLLGFTSVPREAGWWRQSRLLPPFEGGATWVAQALPPAASHYVELGRSALPAISSGDMLQGLPAPRDLSRFPATSISGMPKPRDRAGWPLPARSAPPAAASTGHPAPHAGKRGDVGQ